MSNEIAVYRQAMIAQRAAREEYNETQTDENFEAWLDAMNVTSQAWHAIADKEKPVNDQ